MLVQGSHNPRELEFKDNDDAGINASLNLTLSYNNQPSLHPSRVSQPVTNPHQLYFNQNSLSDCENNNNTPSNTESDHIPFNDNLLRGPHYDLCPDKSSNTPLESPLLGQFDLVTSLVLESQEVNSVAQPPSHTSYNQNLLPTPGVQTQLGHTPSYLKDKDIGQGEAKWIEGPPSPTELLPPPEEKPFPSSIKMSDAHLSTVKPDPLKSTASQLVGGRKWPSSAPNTPETLRRLHLSKSRLSSVEGVMTSSLIDKREKMEYNQMMRSLTERDTQHRPLSYHGKSASSLCSNDHYQPGQGSLVSLPTAALGVVNKRHIMSSGTRSRKESVLLNRRSLNGPYIENRYREKFDVTDLDTNLPRIDMEAIENHLRQAREEERKRRSDREEIRRRLALESEEMGDKPRKHNLHSRLQSSMNLQICFMNETASDSESPNSDSELKNQQPVSLPCLNKTQGSSEGGSKGQKYGGEDFFVKQARLQSEARQALAQAKDLARLQINHERENRAQSPITEMVRTSLGKVGVALPPDRRRVSRQFLTEMNVAQLQVIVNDLHSHIEKLNERLVRMLLERDDLHMEQDSMLVDIEDLTRYLAAKHNSPHQSLPLISASQSLLGRK